MASSISSALLSAGVFIGPWGELKSLNAQDDFSVRLAPNEDALHLYVAAQHLARWLGPQNFFVIQIDNSTAPAEDEIDVFNFIVGKSSDCQYVDLGGVRTFFVSNEFEKINNVAVVLINFMLIFSWHVHLVSDTCFHGRRLAIQDGVAYLCGGEADIEKAAVLVKKFIDNPLSL